MIIILHLLICLENLQIKSKQMSQSPISIIIYQNDTIDTIKMRNMYFHCKKIEHKMMQFAEQFSLNFAILTIFYDKISSND